MKYTDLLIIYILIIGFVAIFLTAYDKRAAKKHKERIPERILMLTGFAGGALPMLVTMLIIRHKTKHSKFMVGLPLQIIIHIAIALAVVYLKG